LTDAEHPTVEELAGDTGLDRGVVRKVVRALQNHGVVVVEEPGDRITAAMQMGLTSTATPTTIKPEVVSDFNIPRTHDKEKG
jgi:DNA-binding transcriptional regulator YhcF (GntR family)